MTEGNGLPVTWQKVAAGLAAILFVMAGWMFTLLVQGSRETNERLREIEEIAQRNAADAKWLKSLKEGCRNL